MKRKWISAAPFVAIGAIVLLYGGSLLDFGSAPDAKQDEAPPVEETAVPAPPAAEPASPVRQLPPAVDSGDDEGVLEWSTYHGGTKLAGLVAVTLPDNPTRLWQFQADSAVYHTPVSCGERIYFTTTRGGVFALDFQGNEVWSKHLTRGTRRDGTPRKERLDAPAACFDSTLLVGSIAGILYAFDAATGDSKWTHDSEGPILGTVNLYRPPGGSGPDQVFVIGQDDGTLHSINLATGEELWQTEGIDRCDGSPAVGQGAIVFGSCAAALHIYSAEDGTLLKNIEIDEDSQIASGVAIVGDSIFSGSHSGKLIHANMRTGEIVWLNEDTDYEVFSTPAVNSQWVIFSADDGIVYGLDRATGKQQWRFETDGFPTSAVISKDKVVVPSDGVLYLLRLQTGEKLWSYEVSDQISSPAIIGEMIVVSSDDGTVTAFGARPS